MQDGRAQVRLDRHLFWSLGTYQFEDDTPFLLARYFYVKEDPAVTCFSVFSTSNVKVIHAKATTYSTFPTPYCNLKAFTILYGYSMDVNECVSSTTIQWDGGALFAWNLRQRASGPEINVGLFHEVP